MERDKAVSEVESLGKKVTRVREQREIMRDRMTQTEKSLKWNKTNLHGLTKLKDKIIALHDQLQGSFSPIESTMSCISCLELLSKPDPRTLLCGHAICIDVSGCVAS